MVLRGLGVGGWEIKHGGTEGREGEREKGRKGECVREEGCLHFENLSVKLGG